MRARASRIGCDPRVLRDEGQLQRRAQPSGHAFIVTATVGLIGDGKDTGTLECDLDDPRATLNSYQATLVPDTGGNEELPITLTGATSAGGKQLGYRLPATSRRSFIAVRDKALTAVELRELL